MEHTPLKETLEIVTSGLTAPNGTYSFEIVTSGLTAPNGKCSIDEELDPWEITLCHRLLLEYIDSA